MGRALSSTLDSSILCRRRSCFHYGNRIMVNDLANLSGPWKDQDWKCEDKAMRERDTWDLWVWAPCMQIFPSLVQKAPLTEGDLNHLGDGMTKPMNVSQPFFSVISVLVQWAHEHSWWQRWKRDGT